MSHHTGTLFAAPLFGFIGLLLFAVAVLFLPRLRRIAKERIRALHALSDGGRARLDEVGELPDPFTSAIGGKALTLGDIFHVYLNSREHLRLAHCARLLEVNDPAAAYLVSRLDVDHVRVRGLVLSGILERTLGRAVPGWYPMYSNALLWTYSEEQELLLQLSEHCAEPSKTLILARVS